MELATSVLSSAGTTGTGSSRRGVPTRCTPALASRSASLFQKESASDSEVWAFIQSRDVGYRAVVVLMTRHYLSLTCSGPLALLRRGLGVRIGLVI